MELSDDDTFDVFDPTKPYIERRKRSTSAMDGLPSGTILVNLTEDVARYLSELSYTDRPILLVENGVRFLAIIEYGPLMDLMDLLKGARDLDYSTGEFAAGRLLLRLERVGRNATKMVEAWTAADPEISEKAIREAKVSMLLAGQFARESADKELTGSILAGETGRLIYVKPEDVPVRRRKAADKDASPKVDTVIPDDAF